MFEKMYYYGRLYLPIGDGIYQIQGERDSFMEETLSTVEIDDVLYLKDEKTGEPDTVLAISPHKTGTVVIVGTAKRFGDEKHVLDGCTGISEIIFPKGFWGEDAFSLVSSTPVVIKHDSDGRVSGTIKPNILPVFPHVLLSNISNIPLKIAFACGYMTQPECYDPKVAKRYEKWIAEHYQSIIFYCKECGYSWLLDSLAQRGFRHDPLSPDDPDFIEKYNAQSSDDQEETCLRLLMTGHANKLIEYKLFTFTHIALAAKYHGSQEVSLFLDACDDTAYTTDFFIHEVFGWKEYYFYYRVYETDNPFSHYETKAACKKATVVSIEDRMESLKMVFPRIKMNASERELVLKFAAREACLPLVRFLLDQGYMWKTSRLDALAIHPLDDVPGTRPEAQIYEAFFNSPDGAACVGEIVQRAGYKLHLYRGVLVYRTMASAPMLENIVKYADPSPIDPMRLIAEIADKNDIDALKTAHKHGLIQGIFYPPFIDYAIANKNEEFAALLETYWKEEDPNGIQGTKEWYYVRSGNSICLTRYLKHEQIVKVPDSIDGLPVHDISAGVFNRKPNLEVSSFDSPSKQIMPIVAVYCPSLTIWSKLAKFEPPYLLLCPASSETVEEKMGVPYYGLENRYSLHSCTDVNGITEQGLIWVKRTDDTIAIIKYIGKETNVTLPATIEGYPVTMIAQFAFKDSVAQNLSIPDTLCEIHWDAFTDSALSSQYFDELVEKNKNIHRVGFTFR